MRKDDDDDIYIVVRTYAVCLYEYVKCNIKIQKVLRVLLQAFTHTHKLHLH